MVRPIAYKKQAPLINIKRDRKSNKNLSPEKIRKKSAIKNKLLFAFKVVFRKNRKTLISTIKNEDTHANKP